MLNFFRWICERLSFFNRRDPLTNLPDRSALKKLNQKRFQDRVVSVVFLDLDNFKQINDCLGHQFGDIVLKEFANLLRREVRSKDLAVRWGGDEFLVCLFDANKKEAAKFLNRIKIKTSRLDVTRRDDFLKLKEKLSEKFSSCKEVNDRLEDLGVSGGISEIRENLFTAIGLADSCMYKDKNKRKDFSKFEIKVLKPLPKEEKEDLIDLLEKLNDQKPRKIIEKLKEEGFVITKRI